MQEGKKSLGMLKMCNLEGKFLSPVADIKVDFKKFVSDYFILVQHWYEANISRENKAIGIALKHTSSLKLFHMQYRSTLQRI